MMSANIQNIDEKLKIISLITKGFINREQFYDLLNSLKVIIIAKEVFQNLSEHTIEHLLDLHYTIVLFVNIPNDSSVGAYMRYNLLLLKNPYIKYIVFHVNKYDNNQNIFNDSLNILRQITSIPYQCLLFLNNSNLVTRINEDKQLSLSINSIPSLYNDPFVYAIYLTDENIIRDFIVKIFQYMKEQATAAPAATASAATPTNMGISEAQAAAAPASSVKSFTLIELNKLENSELSALYRYKNVAYINIYVLLRSNNEYIENIERMGYNIVIYVDKTDINMVILYYLYTNYRKRFKYVLFFTTKNNEYFDNFFANLLRNHSYGIIICLYEYLVQTQLKDLLTDYSNKYTIYGYATSTKYQEIRIIPTNSSNRENIENSNINLENQNNNEHEQEQEKQEESIETGVISNSNNDDIRFIVDLFKEIERGEKTIQEVINIVIESSYYPSEYQRISYIEKIIYTVYYLLQKTEGKRNLNMISISTGSGHLESEITRILKAIKPINVYLIAFDRPGKTIDEKYGKYFKNGDNCNFYSQDELDFELMLRYYNFTGVRLPDNFDINFDKMNRNARKIVSILPRTDNYTFIFSNQIQTDNYITLLKEGQFFIHTRKNFFKFMHIFIQCLIEYMEIETIDFYLTIDDVSKKNISDLSEYDNFIRERLYYGSLIYNNILAIFDNLENLDNYELGIIVDNVGKYISQKFNNYNEMNQYIIRSFPVIVSDRKLRENIPSLKFLRIAGKILNVY